MTFPSNSESDLLFRRVFSIVDDEIGLVVEMKSVTSFSISSNCIELSVWGRKFALYQSFTELICQKFYYLFKSAKRKPNPMKKSREKNKIDVEFVKL